MKINRNLLICVLVICFGTQFQLHNVTVTSNLALVWRVWFNESFFQRYQRDMNDAEFSLAYAIVAACFQIGATLGTLSIRMLSEKLGRRRTLILAGLTECAGAILAGLSKLTMSYELLGFGRLVTGLGLGAGMGVGPMMVSELAPSEVRGIIGTVQQIFLGLGMTSGFALSLPSVAGTPELWPIAVAFPAVPAIMQVLILCWACESPKYLLLTRKDRMAALKSFEFYRGQIEAHKALDLLEAEHEQIKSQQSITFIQFIRSRLYRRALIISVLLPFSVQFTGIGPTMSFFTTIFVDAGLDKNTSTLVSLGLGVVPALFPFVVMILVDKYGRRLLVLVGLLVVAVSLVITSAMLQLSFHIVNSRAVLFIAISFMYIHRIGFTMLSSVAWIIPPEIFPQNVRSYALALCTTVFWSSQLVTVFGYLPLKNAVGVAISLAPFICISTACFIFFLVYLPETKGVSPEIFLMETINKAKARRIGSTGSREPVALACTPEKKPSDMNESKSDDSLT